MAMSGVKVNDACIKMWEQLKTKKIKACNFKLADNLKEIVVDEGSVVPAGADAPWKAWTASLPDKECRYGYVYNTITLQTRKSYGDSYPLRFGTPGP